MFCTVCGARHEGSAAFCGHCGARLEAQRPACLQNAPAQSVYQVQSWPAYPQFQPGQKTVHYGMGWAIAGLVLSLLGLMLCVIWQASAVAALLGIAFSSLALAKATKAGKGNGLAVGGMVCGIAAVVIAVFIGIFSPELFSSVPDAGMDYFVYM